MKTRVLLIALFVAIAAVDTLAQRRSPSETVKSFYRFSSARSNLFNRRHIESRKSWYTSELYQHFVEQLKKDEANLKANPTDKPFFGDGLDFEPLHELCKADGKSLPYTRRVGRTVIEKSVAYVDVTFVYPSACKIPPEVWRVKLQRAEGRWLIADWIYPDKSSLVGDMQENRF